MLVSCQLDVSRAEGRGGVAGGGGRGHVVAIILLSNFYYVLNEISAYANSLVVDT